MCVCGGGGGGGGSISVLMIFTKNLTTQESVKLTVQASWWMKGWSKGFQTRTCLDCCYTLSLSHARDTLSLARAHTHSTCNSLLPFPTSSSSSRAKTVRGCTFSLAQLLIQEPKKGSWKTCPWKAAGPVLCRLMFTKMSSMTVSVQPQCDAERCEYQSCLCWFFPFWVSDLCKDLFFGWIYLFIGGREKVFAVTLYLF